MIDSLSPIRIVFGFFIAVVALRAFELFVLQTNEWIDPTMVSRILGVLLVGCYLYRLRQFPGFVGMHGKDVAPAIGIGGLSLVVMFSILYALAFHALHVDGESPRWVIGVIDAQGGLVTGTTFLLVYLAGQVLNAFMEEGIFRGIMLPQLMRRMSFRKANVAQASLFALAHLVWPLGDWTLGQASYQEALAEAGALFVFTMIGGLIFGYLYYRTNSLWTPICAHLVDNTFGLFVHIETATRFNAETDVSILTRVAFLSVVLIAWWIARRLQLPALRPAGT